MCGGITMENIDIKRLLVNFKTLEEFENFREYGAQELSMKEDLRANITEDDSESPFYGIYYGNKLVARMSLYRIDKKYDRYFEPAQDFYELWKLEVLDEYRGKGLGEALVKFSQKMNLPVKTNARQRSDEFWVKMGFNALTYFEGRDRGENPYVWFPKGVTEQE